MSNCVLKHSYPRHECLHVKGKVISLTFHRNAPLEPILRVTEESLLSFRSMLSCSRSTFCSLHVQEQMGKTNMPTSATVFNKNMSLKKLFGILP
jgi:hypothetical protein